MTTIHIFPVATMEGQLLLRLWLLIRKYITIQHKDNHLEVIMNCGSTYVILIIEPVVGKTVGGVVVSSLK